MKDRVVQAASASAKISLYALLTQFIETGDEKVFDQINIKLSGKIDDDDALNVKKLVTKLENEFENASQKLSNEQSSFPALIILGLAYKNPKFGIKVDVKKAITYFEIVGAARTKEANYAHYLLGKIYQTADGVPQDLAKAIKYYQAAPDNGAALVALAMIYKDGNTVKTDVPQALKYLAQAENKKNPTALYQLAKIHQSGLHVKKDLVKAITLLQSSAEQGYLPALNELAMAYLHGRGIPKNIGLAIELFTLANQIISEASIDQEHLRYRTELFLAHLTFSNEEKQQLSQRLPSAEGMCNGYMVMLLRAAGIGQVSKFEERLTIFSKMDYSQIQRMGELFTDFQNNYAVIASKTDRDEFSTGAERKSSDVDSAQDSYDQYISEQTYNTMKLSPTDRVLLDFARDYFVFISSLIYSQAPDDLNHQVGNKIINQNDIPEMLQLIPPDKFLHGLPLISSFVIAFNFTEAELLKCISACIGEGDFVIIRSTNHVVFFAKENFLFYDSNNKKMKIFTEYQQLVAEMKSGFFLKKGRDATYMPIHLTSIHLGADSIAKPNPQQIINDILLKRETPKSVDAPSWNGTTALWLAAKWGNVDIIDALLEQKADPNAADNNGNTPVYMAAQFGQAAAIKMLAAKNADLNVCNLLSNTAAHVAVQRNHMNVLRVLTDYKANFNIKNKQGNTPLHIAAAQGRAEAAECLIKAGANMLENDSDQQQPIHLALKNQCWNVVAVILLNSNPQINFGDLDKKVLSNREKIINGFQNYINNKNSDDEKRIALLDLISGKNALYKLFLGAKMPLLAFLVPTKTTTVHGHQIPQALLQCIEPFKHLLQTHQTTPSLK
ncbi:MAG: ankyrin repeat domain-containing protein [Gammaproteobacteria bacterium]